jgi:CheY-like chemotaxis protein
LVQVASNVTGRCSVRLLPGGGIGSPYGAGAGGPNGMANVVIAGGSDETRLLLRGLVRLHHHRVLAEGHGPETLNGLSAPTEPLVLLLDIDLEDSAWAAQLARTLPLLPGVRPVLLTTNRSSSIDVKAHEAGFVKVLRRPFAVHDLVEALEPAPGT